MKRDANTKSSPPLLMDLSHKLLQTTQHASLRTGQSAGNQRMKGFLIVTVVTQGNPLLFATKQLGFASTVGVPQVAFASIASAATETRLGAVR